MIRYIHCYFKLKSVSIDEIEASMSKGKDITSNLINKLQSSSKAVITKDEVKNYKDIVEYLNSSIEIEKAIDQMKKLADSYKSHQKYQELKEQMKIFEVKHTSLFTKRIYDFFNAYQTIIIAILKPQLSKSK